MVEKDMLIPFDQVFLYLAMNGIQIQGILHLGAHECEEKILYNKCGIEDEAIVWIDGNQEKVTKMKGVYPNAHIYMALIDEDEHDVTFRITNNGESSSILPLETHQRHYPTILVTEEQQRKTTTLAKFIETMQVPIERLTFWNLDIQGVELAALKGAGSYLSGVDAIYCEVNVEPLYKGCALLPEMDAFLTEKGFTRVAIHLVPQGWGDALYVRESKLRKA